MKDNKKVVIDKDVLKKSINDTFASFLIIFFYYVTALLFSNDSNKFSNVFGFTLGPLIKEALYDLGIIDFDPDDFTDNFTDNINTEITSNINKIK